MNHIVLQGSTSKELYQLNDEEPVLINLNSNQDIQLKICESSWSKAFGLNAAGTSGVVICHDHERGNKVYRMHASTSFSNCCPALTKIVSIAPYFIVVNNCRKHLRFMEDNEKADLWIDLAPTKVNLNLNRLKKF
jgi:vacuolar protein sorting-associated protein 13A/C